MTTPESDPFGMAQQEQVPEITGDPLVDEMLFRAGREALRDAPAMPDVAELLPKVFSLTSPDEEAPTPAPDEPL